MKQSHQISPKLRASVVFVWVLIFDFSFDSWSRPGQKHLYLG